ncbi:MAG: hypothetical protein AAGB13_14615 [Cyanobacteria bacterium P01_F01_bin.33]
MVKSFAAGNIPASRKRSHQLLRAAILIIIRADPPSPVGKPRVLMDVTGPAARRLSHALNYIAFELHCRNHRRRD